MKNLDYLNKLLDDFDSAEHDAHQRHADRQQSKRVEIERFADYASKEIEPTLIAIGTRLRQRGHDYEIFVHPSKQHLAFNFYPRTIARELFKHDSTPQITFAWNLDAHRVSVHYTDMTPKSGGVSTPAGDIELQAVNRDFINEVTIRMVESVLGNLKDQRNRGLL